MDSAEFDSGKIYWRNFSFRTAKNAFVILCLLGFSAGIWLYQRDLDRSPAVNGANGSYTSTAAIGQPDNGYPGDLISPIFPPDNYLISSAITPDIFYT